MKTRPTTIKQKLILIICGFVISFLVVESSLRLGGFLWLLLQDYRNSSVVKQNNTYRILCLGESTTALGGKNSYPRQLEAILNQRGGEQKVRVINKGVPCTNTDNIVAALEYNLNKYQPDTVITMMGINDSYDIKAGNVAGKNKDYQAILNRLRTYKLAVVVWDDINFKLKKVEGSSLVNRLSAVLKAKKTFPFDDLEEGLSGEDDTCDESLALGKRYLSERKFVEGEATLRNVIQTCPGRQEAYSELAGYYLWIQGDFEKAEEILKQSLKINNRDSNAYADLGELYRDQDARVGDCVSFLERALALDPQNIKVYGDLGACYQMLNKVDEAKKVFEKLVAMNSENEEALIELGICFWRLGEHDKAKSTIKKALAVNPESKYAHGVLARYYIEEGEDALAEEHLKKIYDMRAKDINPKTRQNYQEVKNRVLSRKIKLVAVQYPLCSVKILKDMVEDDAGVVFVDNEKLFQDAIAQTSYDELFFDSFAGDFGHCTARGNRLLAENIANAILAEW